MGSSHQNVKQVLLKLEKQGIAGLQFLKKNINQLGDKKIAVFAVGASPYDEKVIQQIRDIHFKDALSNIEEFLGGNR